MSAPTLCACGCGRALTVAQVRKGGQYAAKRCMSAPKYQATLASVISATRQQHEPQRSWWADGAAQRDRLAFRGALAERRPHLGLTRFGMLHGTGITAPSVKVVRPVAALGEDGTV
jgi:hypothetical protein